MFGSLGAPEIIVIALIALLVFGAGRIADVGKGLGQGIRNFKQGLREASDDGIGDGKSDDGDKLAKTKKATDES
jgi:sec-independent protein translocase protein TatA